MAAVMALRTSIMGVMRDYLPQITAIIHVGYSYEGCGGVVLYGINDDMDSLTLIYHLTHAQIMTNFHLDLVTKFVNIR